MMSKAPAIPRHMQPEVNLYPFKDKLLRNRKGERWLIIPETEDLLLVSNHGRIKALPLNVQRTDGVSSFTKERIVGQYFQKNHNQLVGDYVYQLYAGVQLQGRRYRFNVRRLVYHMFVSPIPLELPYDKLVTVKDGDGFNCKPKNLELISIAEKQQRIFDKKRSESPFLHMSAIQHKEMDQKDHNRKLVVKQYAIDGSLLNVFTSITEAAKVTGTNLTGISLVAQGKARSAGGYVWRYRGGRYNGGLAKLSAFKRVIQYSMDGQIVGSFKTIKDAATANNANHANIRSVLIGERKQACGFVWRYEDHPYNGEWAKLRTKKERKIEQLTLVGKRVKVYDTITEAARLTGISIPCIVTVAKGRRKHAGNFCWKYVD